MPLQKHQARIYAICRRLAGNDADALDATQEALIAIVKGLDRFDGRGVHDLVVPGRHQRLSRRAPSPESSPATRPP